MLRVSSTMQSFQLSGDMLRLEGDRYKANKSITSGFAFDSPSEDPEAMLLGMKIRNSQALNAQHLKNASEVKGYVDYLDGTLGHMTEVMQRLRELAVQSANGTLSAEDRENVSREVIGLTQQLAGIANEQYNGKYLFSGYEILRPPFQVSESGDELKGVTYVGDNGTMEADIGNNDKIAYSIPGSKLFFSEIETIIPQKNLADFIVKEDSTIRINGVSIDLFRGDTLDTVMERINKANAGIRANFDMQTQEFYLETTYPHKPMLEDVKGTILGDMGITDPIGKPPNNLLFSTKRFGGSLFDQLINFASSLKNNDSEGIGARTIQSIDLSINNMMKYRTDIGAKGERLALTTGYLDNMNVILQDQFSNAMETDMTQAITRAKTSEFMYQAAIQIGSKINELSLLNFMK